MLTYDFSDLNGRTLTEYLYARIREDILSGRLKEGMKMPSKRSFAGNIGVSTITVENAYAQLTAEGYLRAEPRRGFFVAPVGSLLEPSGGGAPAPRTGSFPALSGVRVSAPSPGRAPEPSGGGRGRSREAEQKSGIPEAEQKSGIPEAEQKSGISEAELQAQELIDLTGAAADRETFPFAAWARISRKVLTERRDALLTRAPGAGILELREAIAQYLLQYQGLDVSPGQIIVGAGTEYLYSLLIRLLGPDRTYAVETPGYPKTARIYESNRVNVCHIPMDRAGIRTDKLEKSGADVVHISPSHQFPTGITMPVGRRAELLEWAGKTAAGRYIIEDDYDSEFRLSGRPIPPLMSIDHGGRVIYLNTFTKSLASTIRISYMVLPAGLLEQYRERLGFYSCTVSNFEQYTLAAFIREGFFEKHINRMRTYYRQKQDRLLQEIAQGPLEELVRVKGTGAGLHFLMEVRTDRSERELSALALDRGVKIAGLQEYAMAPEADGEKMLPAGNDSASGTGDPQMVVSYIGLSDRQIRKLPSLLAEAWM